MPPVPVPVHWEIARDTHFRRAVRSGDAAAIPDDGHSVHIDVRGLRPATDYFYRFRCIRSRMMMAMRFMPRTRSSMS